MRRARRAYLLVVLVASAACASVPETSLPPSIVPQAPVVITDTPSPLKVPVTATDTASPTPGLPPQIPDTPAPAAPTTRWWDAYFTDPLTINDPSVIAGSIEEKLIQFISTAQTTIHIASFEFNLTPVADALIAAKNRGVDVRWVTDDIDGLGYDTKPGRGQFASLTAAGVQVKDDAGRSSLMHDKFWIFDGQVVWTGSTNITVDGIFKQNNNVLVIHSSQIAFIYEREFDDYWNQQFGPNTPSSVDTQWAILDGSAVQILFSPEDHAMSNLVALINDAKVSIRFLAFSFTDNSLSQAMIARAAAGVQLQGVFETFGADSMGSELKTFACAKLPVRLDGNKSFLHDKIIIVDDSIVVTGSLNFSASADDKNEENVVIVDNAELAALYLQEFNKLWAQAHDFDAAAITCSGP